MSRRVPAPFDPSQLAALACVGAGALLGPHAVRRLTGSGVSALEAAAWVSLAVLGLLVGLAFPRSRSSPGPGVARSALTAAVAATIVAVGQYLLLASWGLPLAADAVGASTVVGLCASISGTPFLRPGGTRDTQWGAHFAVRQAWLPAAAGVTTVAVLAAGAAPLRLAVTVLVGAAVGAAGRLLLQDARTPSERNVFVTGAVLLLGGAGAYLGTSPLLSGFAAAIAWRWDGDEASHLTIRDVGVLRHPLVALLLVFAGASVRWNEAVLWLTASIALLGLLGKLVSAFAFSRRFGVSPTAFTAVMLQPGVLAIALAFNAGQLLGHAYQDVVSAFTVAWSIWVIAATFLPADGAVERV